MREKKNTTTENKKVSPKTSRVTRNEKEKYRLYFCMIIMLFGALIGYQQKEIRDLKQSNEVLKNDMEKNIAQVKKVYVYNLEKTLKGIRLENLNREFEEKLNILNDEVSIAQKKISSFKNSKEKDNFSEIYLKSLKLKRDTMIQEYNHTLEDLTEQVNKAIGEIAKEKNVVVIWDVRAVASLTENIEDVTEEVIKKVKLQRPKAMNE